MGWELDHTAIALKLLAALHRCLGDYQRARRHVIHASEILLAVEGARMHYGMAQHQLALVALETGRPSETDSLFSVVSEAMARGLEWTWFSSWKTAPSRFEESAGESRPALEDGVQAIRARWRERVSACADD